MRVLRKILIYSLSAAIIVSNFMFLPTAKAVPSPTNGCLMKVADGHQKLVCTYESKSIYFTFENFYKSNESAALLDVDDLYQFWKLDEAGSSGVHIYAVAKGTPTESKNNIKIYYIGKTQRNVESAEQVYEGKVTDPDLMESGYITFTNYSLATGEMTGSNQYISVYRGPGISDKIVPASGEIYGVVRKLSENLPMSEVRMASRTPDSTKFESCKANLTNPVSGLSDGDGLASFYAEMRTKWMTELNKLPDGTEKDDAIRIVDNTFNDPNKLYTKADDIKLFKQFYREEHNENDFYPPNYPTVVVDQAKYNEYTDVAAPLNTLIVGSTDEAEYHWLGLGSILKNGDIRLRDINSAKPTWVDSFILAIPGTSGLYLRTAALTIKYFVYQSSMDASNIVKEQMKLYFAHLYIKNNLEFNKCMGEPFAYNTAEEIDKLIQNVDSILDDSYTDLNPYGGDKDKTVCDEIKDDNMIAATIRKAMCGLLVIIKGWADDFFKWALGWLKASLGVQDPNNGLQIDTEKIEKVTMTPAGGTSSSSAGESGGATAAQTIDINTKIKIMFDKDFTIANNSINTKMKNIMGENWKALLSDGSKFSAEVTPNGGTKVEKSAFQQPAFSFTESGATSYDMLIIYLTLNDVGKADKYAIVIKFKQGAKEIVKLVDVPQEKLTSVPSNSSSYLTFTLKGDSSFPVATCGNCQ